MKTPEKINLQEEAVKINSWHVQITKSDRSSLGIARDIGERLVKVMDHFGFKAPSNRRPGDGPMTKNPAGTLKEWILKNCNFSDRTGTDYIKVYRNWELVKEEPNRAQALIKIQRKNLTTSLKRGSGEAYAILIGRSFSHEIRQWTLAEKKALHASPEILSHWIKGLRQMIQPAPKVKTAA